MNERLKKEWKARDEDGSIYFVTSIEDVPLQKGKWLVLARYNDKLIKLKRILREMGIYFEYKNRKSYKTRLLFMPFKTIHDGQMALYYPFQNAKIYLNILAKNFQKKKKECMT